MRGGLWDFIECIECIEECFRMRTVLLLSLIVSTMMVAVGCRQQEAEIDTVNGYSDTSLTANEVVTGNIEVELPLSVGPSSAGIC